MRRRVFTAAAVVLGIAVLCGLLRVDRLSERTPTTAIEIPADDTPMPAPSSKPPGLVAAERVATPVAGEPELQAPVDVDARARFNERARAFFANAAGMKPQDRVHEAEQIERELARVEQAGGLSAGETLLVRAGLIRETVPDEAEQAAQLRALRQRYEAETQRRVAWAQARSDPQFGSYKARESEIVREVMAMETIPDGLSRNEYLRQRLQRAREQLTP